MGILRQRMRITKARGYYPQHLVSNHKDLPPITYALQCLSTKFKANKVQSHNVERLLIQYMQ